MKSKMVESIKELREICQKRTQLYDKKGEKNTSKPVDEYFYDRFLRLVSIYLTWIFLHFPISGNTVTIISMVVGLIAGVMFGFAHPLFWVIGFLLTQMFHFLDAADGEVARYRKEASPIGKYFDLLAHGVVIAAFYAGMTIGVYRSTGEFSAIILGLVCLSSFLLISLSGALLNFLKYNYFWMEKKELAIKDDDAGSVVYTWKYALRRLLGFDGIVFVALFVALLDWCFLPLSFNFIGKDFFVNFRYIFLLISAIAGPVIFCMRMRTASLSRKMFE